MSVIDEGTVLGDRYVLGPLLGRGGMADVYAGRDRRLERDVAIKVLRPEVAARGPEVQARFEAEARTAARLAHPNAVAVYDTGERNGQPFIVMERLPGDTLADRIRAGPVDLGWLRLVAGDVLGALGAAHATGMVHRDVKPGNILLAADGRAMVADFGIAKSFDGLGPDLTATNVLIGTPAYLAPEQLHGRPASPRSDLYALGVVLYEAAAGRKPFEADTPIALALAVEQGDIELLTQVRPDVDGALAATVGRAMDPDPARRFGSATEMAAALGLAPAADTTVEDLVPAAPDQTMVAAVPLVEGPRRISWRPLAAVAVAVLALVALVLSARGDGGNTPARADSDAPATTSATTSARPETTSAERVTPTTEAQLQVRISIPTRGGAHDPKGKAEDRKGGKDD